jgi:V8-like Glu-specific endopeptidase
MVRAMFCPSRCFFLASVLPTAFALSACADSPPENVGASTSAIISGNDDDVDVSVVWIVAKVGAQTGYCSGVIVSPHVVLTAGHCSDANATFSIFLGSDYNDTTAKAQPDNYVAVTEHHPHPKYNPNDNLHDIGVLVTAAPIPRQAAALNRDPMQPSDRGAPIRIVGFGQTAPDDKTIGRRHEATTTLADFDATGLEMTGTPSFCLFDSGGPTFMTRGGTEVVTGIHSIVESTSCDQAAWDVRVDVHTDFVDGFIASVDAVVDGGEGEASTDAAQPEDAAEPVATPSPARPACSIGAPARTSDRALALTLAASLVGRLSRRRRKTTRDPFGRPRSS